MVKLSMSSRIHPHSTTAGRDSPLVPLLGKEPAAFFLTPGNGILFLQSTNYPKILTIHNFHTVNQMKKRSDPIPAKQRLDQMLSKLKDHDFRITPQRLAVLKVLAASDGHPSVERIYDTVRTQFPTTSIATIYKTVALLKQEKEVLEISFPDGSNRYDGNKPYPHPHLICTRCKKIIDPDLSSLEDLAREITKETGFKISTHRVDFFGLCRECQ